MDPKQEKDIIRTLVKAGNEELAKTFARSRGYSVKADAGAALIKSLATLNNYQYQVANQLKGWIKDAVKVGSDPDFIKDAQKVAKTAKEASDGMQALYKAATTLG